MTAATTITSLAVVAGLATIGGQADAATSTVARAAAPAAASPTARDPFYRYRGHKPLRKIKPGTVLKKRVVTYHVAGVPAAVPVTQLLYRTKDMRGRAVVNATSVLQLPNVPRTASVVSYQSFYDSLNPNDEPSVAIAGRVGTGDGIAYSETGIIAPALLSGATVVITDTEGQRADFAAGPEYGITTLDGLRATLNTKKFDLPAKPRIGLLGYSGGAIATEWAAELAPRYAPGLNKRIVGSAYGGVFVEPDHNLHYVEGTPIWSGTLPEALVGVGRAFGVNLSKYATKRGKKILHDTKHAAIGDVLGRYPGLTWSDLVQKKYPQPENLRVFLRLSNQLIMGRSKGKPHAPMFIGQGTGGEAEGTPGNKKHIGKGDGVMIAGDVRSLARGYCRRGVRVDYQQYPGLSHVAAASVFLPQAYQWLLTRLTTPSAKAPSSCGSIAKGNHLGPVKYRPGH